MSRKAQPNAMNDEDNTIYRIGVIIGLASVIDRNVLSELCLHPPKGFKYADQLWQVHRLLEDIDKDK